MLALLLIVSATAGALCFVCSLAEAVLLSLNPLALQVRSARGERQAAQWLSLKQEIERPISAILVINTLSNTGLATLAGALFTSLFGPEWLWIFTLALTGLVIFGGELAPKIIGVHHADRVAPHLIGPLLGLVRFARPLVSVMERFCRLWKPAAHSATGTNGGRIMDILTLVEAARAEQVLHNREEIIIIHAATLSARRVRTAMVPRESIAWFDARRSLLENVRTLGPKPHRSYPVTSDGTPEGVVGYVRIRELFVQHMRADTADPPPDWQTLIRPVLTVDESATLTQLLALFLDRSEIAALVDTRAGGVSGWITMDDVMKVLMGERV